MAHFAQLKARGSRLDRDAGAFYHALNDLIRVYQFRDRDRICCYDISVTQCYALDALVRGGPLTLNALAAELYLDKSTASRVVDGLEARGYVRRNAHPEDRRSLLLEVTPRGADLQGRIEGEIIDEEKGLLADLSPEVRQAAIELLGRLARAAADRVQVGGGSCCRI